MADKKFHVRNNYLLDSEYERVICTSCKGNVKIRIIEENEAICECDICEKTMGSLTIELSKMVIETFAINNGVVIDATTRLMIMSDCCASIITAHKTEKDTYFYTCLNCDEELNPREDNLI